MTTFDTIVSAISNTDGISSIKTLLDPLLFNISIDNYKFLLSVLREPMYWTMYDKVFRALLLYAIDKNNVDQARCLVSDRIDRLPRIYSYSHYRMSIVECCIHKKFDIALELLRDDRANLHNDEWVRVFIASYDNNKLFAELAKSHITDLPKLIETCVTSRIGLIDILTNWNIFFTSCSITVWNYWYEYLIYHYITNKNYIHKDSVIKDIMKSGINIDVVIIKLQRVPNKNKHISRTLSMLV